MILGLGQLWLLAYLPLIYLLNVDRTEYLVVIKCYTGYEIFGGDSTQPAKLERVFTGLIAHYSVNIQAKIYKIDSWNN
jgi:hypothetical protein